MRHIPTMPDRRLPLALIGGALLQAAAALWWAAEQGSVNRYQDVRLTSLESRNDIRSALDKELLDRLARIEERLATQSATLSDIKNNRR